MAYAIRSGAYSMKEVYLVSGGKIPEDLSGEYTSEAEAQKAIDLFEAKRDQKIKKRSKKG